MPQLQKKFKFIFPLGLLFGIVLVGILSRVIYLDRLVLVHDEMSIGYNAYSLLQTGQDEWGVKWPLVFKAFGDYKLPGYIYFTLLNFKLFGVSDLTLKLSSIFSGIAIMIGTCWTLLSLTKKWSVGLIGAAILALSVWPVHMSRLAIESNLATAFFVFAFLAIVRLFKNEGQWQLWGFVLGLSLAGAVYSYVALRMSSLLIIASLAVIVWKWHKPVKGFLLSAVVFGLLTIPLANQLLSPSGTARFNQVSIFSSDEVRMIVNEQRANCFIAEPQLAGICKIMFNKPLTLLDQVVANHNTFILPSFIFISGAGDDLVYTSMPHLSELHWILWPFYLGGIYVVWSKRKKASWLILLLCWLIVVVPSSLTGSPQLIRGEALLPLIAMFTAIGLGVVGDWLAEKKFGNWIFGAGLLIILLFMIRSLLNYIVIYPVQYSWRSYPLPKETVLDVIQLADSYDLIYFDDYFPDAHISLAWYGKFDPAWYQRSVQFPSADAVGFQHPSQLGNYQFGTKEPRDLICDPDLSGQKILYISGKDDRIPSKLGKDYFDPTGVHITATVIDLNHWQDQLLLAQSLTSFCE